MDREIISKLEKEVQRTYSIKTTVFQNGEKVSEEINTHREPCVRIPIEMADKILALLKEQQTIIDELLKVGYPHNFQREEPWIVNYMLKITEVIKKAVHLRNGEKESEHE